MSLYPKKQKSDVTFSGETQFTGDSQQAHIADASEAHALNASFSDTEVEAALDALGGKINAILVALETRGVLADS